MWPFYLGLLGTGMSLAGSAVMIGLSQAESETYGDMVRETPLLARHGCKNPSNQGACYRYVEAAATANNMSDALYIVGIATSLTTLGAVGIAAIGYALSPTRAVTVAPTAGGLMVRGTF